MKQIVKMNLDFPFNETKSIWAQRFWNQTIVIVKFPRMKMNYVHLLRLRIITYSMVLATGFSMDTYEE